MTRLALCILLTLVLMHAGAFLTYGTFSILTGLEPPESPSPVTFMLSVLVAKLGHAVAFVLIFYLARNSLSGRWLSYAFIWWLMFVLGETAEAIGRPSYSWQMALLGMVAEAIYFPLSGFVTDRLLGRSGGELPVGVSR